MLNCRTSPRRTFRLCANLSPKSQTLGLLFIYSTILKQGRLTTDCCLHHFIHFCRKRWLRHTETDTKYIVVHGRQQLIIVLSGDCTNVKVEDSFCFHFAVFQLVRQVNHFLTIKMYVAKKRPRYMLSLYRGY